MAILFFIYTVVLFFVVIIKSEGIKPFDIKATIPLRGILALGIIIHHLARTLTIGTSNFGMHQLAGIGGAIVTLFFFMTGYGLSVSYINKRNEYLHKFFNKRLTKLLIPLIVVIIIYYVECYILNRSNINFEDIKGGSVFSPNSWYVYELIFFYCIFYICCSKFSLRNSAIIILMASLILIALFIKFNFGRPWYRSTLSLSIGMLYAIYEQKIKLFYINHRKLITSTSLLYCSIALIWCIIRIDEYTLINAINNIFLPIITVFILYSIHFPKSRTLDFLGKISYEIYIVHGLIIAFATKWIWDEWTFCLITIPVSIIVAWLLKKICNPMISFFTTKQEFERNFTSEEAKEFLVKRCQPPTGSAICSNVLSNNPQYDLQIVVPAYNAEKYIKNCLDSILNQLTRYRCLVVVVNDGSTDNTAQILESYNDSRLKVITQENRGFSGARNRGLEYINAKYIMFVDSDDMLYPGAIESLMNRALATDADIVEGGYRLFMGCLTLKKVLRNNEGTQLYGFPWGKVYKAHLWQNVHFPEGYWFEDTINIFLIFQMAKKIANVDTLVYHYRKNMKGISVTSKGKLKTLDCLWITRQLMEDRETLGMKNDNDFLPTLKWQIGCNAKRISTLHSSDIDKAAEIIHNEILHRYYQ